MEEYKRNEQDLYANTDNGLDILKKYIPDFALNKNFCYREEKNPSARAYKSNMVHKRFWRRVSLSFTNCYGANGVVLL